MANRRPLIDEDGEVRELTAADAAKAVNFSDLPEQEQKMLLGIRRRGMQKAPRKVPISIRLSPDVAQGLRSTGNGWQVRVDEILRSWLKETTKKRARS